MSDRERGKGGAPRERADAARGAGRERVEAAREAGRERVEAAKLATGERVEAARAAAELRVEAAKAATEEKVGAARAAAGEKVEAARAAAEELQARVKPRLRGVIHGWAFPVSLLAGALVVLLIANTVPGRISVGIYALSLSALLGTSALYHRVDWQRARARLWMRRLDHSMIFVLIAGTITPFAALLLEPPFATAVLIAIWAAAIAGMIVETIWIDAPKWVSAAVYVAVGSLGGLALPGIISSAGIGAGLLIALGAVLYIIGAVVYARQRPDPSPRVFGYHEIFHVLVVAAAAAHFAAVAIYAAPAG